MLTQAVLLVGGKGTRLGSLTSSTPKPLLMVNGKPFLDHLVAQFRRAGVSRFLLLAGYLSEQIESYCEAHRQAGLDIQAVAEPEEAGTGGAIAYAAPYLDDTFLVSNGDSFFDVDMNALISVPPSSNWLGKIALRTVPDAGRYGAVTLAEGKVTGFAERGGAAAGLINGGIYMLRREILRDIPPPPCSIEREVFPRLAAEGRLWGIEGNGMFIDIGVPQDFERAQTMTFA